MDDELSDGAKVVIAFVAVAFVVLILAVLAEAVFRQSELVEMELIKVSSGVVEGDGELPQFAGLATHSFGQFCVGDRVRVLKKSGSGFGWLPTWSLIEKVEDSGE